MGVNSSSVNTPGYTPALDPDRVANAVRAFQCQLRINRAAKFDPRTLVKDPAELQPLGLCTEDGSPYPAFRAKVIKVGDRRRGDDGFAVVADLADVARVTPKDCLGADSVVFPLADIRSLNRHGRNNVRIGGRVVIGPSASIQCDDESAMTRVGAGTVLGRRSAIVAGAAVPAGTVVGQDVQVRANLELEQARQIAPLKAGDRSYLQIADNLPAYPSGNSWNALHAVPVEWSPTGRVGVVERLGAIGRGLVSEFRQAWQEHRRPHL